MTPINIQKKMENPDYEYFFRVSERINGIIYILDGNGKRVVIKGNVQKAKSATKAAQKVYELEVLRNISLEG